MKCNRHRTEDLVAIWIAKSKRTESESFKVKISYVIIKSLLLRQQYFKYKPPENCVTLFYLTPWFILQLNPYQVNSIKYRMPQSTHCLKRQIYIGERRTSQWTGASTRVLIFILLVLWSSEGVGFYIKLCVTTAHNSTRSFHYFTHLSNHTHSGLVSWVRFHFLLNILYIYM